MPGNSPLLKKDATGKKRIFVPRYKRNIDHVRHKREAFDQEAYDRMTKIIVVSFSSYPVTSLSTSNPSKENFFVLCWWKTSFLKFWEKRLRGCFEISRKTHRLRDLKDTVTFAVALFLRNFRVVLL